jgi:hypothetical protein
LGFATPSVARRVKKLFYDKRLAVTFCECQALGGR